ncbi:MAG: hypothetical protein QM756_25540 [Polyangiaceae bacterium]
MWINGVPAHRIAADRALELESDKFEAPVRAGKNQVLVKVDNGSGGWAFSIRAFDGAQRKQQEVLALRRKLELLDPAPSSGSYLLDESFPQNHVSQRRSTRVGVRSSAAERALVRPRSGSSDRSAAAWPVLCAARGHDA